MTLGRRQCTKVGYTRHARQSRHANRQPIRPWYRVYICLSLTIGEENRAAQARQYGEQSFIARFARDGKAWDTGRRAALWSNWGGTLRYIDRGGGGGGQHDVQHDPSLKNLPKKILKRWTTAGWGGRRAHPPPPTPTPWLWA